MGIKLNSQPSLLPKASRANWPLWHFEKRMHTPPNPRQAHTCAHTSVLQVRPSGPRAARVLQTGLHRVWGGLSPSPDLLPLCPGPRRQRNLRSWESRGQVMQPGRRPGALPELYYGGTLWVFSTSLLPGPELHRWQGSLCFCSFPHPQHLRSAWAIAGPQKELWKDRLLPLPNHPSIQVVVRRDK